MPSTGITRRQASRALWLPLVAAGAAATTRPAAAQARFPSRPIRVIVPFAPGQANDIIARLLADKAGEIRWQQGRVVVENRAGAGGTIGMAAGAQAQADGYSLVFGSLATFAINPAVMRNIPYDVERDFAPVIRVFQGALVAVVAAKSPDADLASLVRRAKAGGRNGLTYASSGPGSTQHLATELFLQGIGAQATHVPYRGSGPALTDLAGGAVDFTFESMASVLPLVQSGVLRALAVTSDAPLPQLPGVPTVADAASLPGYSAYGTGGLLAPARTPPAIIETLYEGFAAAVADPLVRARFADIGTNPISEGPAEFKAFIRTELEKWRAVAKKSEIVLD